MLACTALKEIHRSRLMQGLDGPQLVHLQGSIEFIRERMKTRKHKYMPAALLTSQFETLEPPRDAVLVDAALEVPAAVERIAAELARKDPARKP